MKARPFALFAMMGLAAGIPAARAQEPAPRTIRAGIIGLDTSHVPAFTKIFNKPGAGGETGGIRVVAGYPGGTDFPPSRDRVKNFTEQIRGMGVEIVDTIPKLLEKVDVVLLESVDGRIHLKEAIPVIEAGKPLFIDKPLAGSLADAIAIDDAARKHGVPYFSSSSSRFGPGLRELKQSKEVGTLAGADVWGPCSYQEGTPDLFFYGIHGVEALYTLMGTGCESVARVQARDADVVTGVWTGGRVGTYRGIRRNKATSGAVAFGTDGIVQATKWGNYEDLCREIAAFFKTGKPPVHSAETIEIMAFMEAADRSKMKGGASVSLAEVLADARAQAASGRGAR
jgi:hypothetical protein